MGRAFARGFVVGCALAGMLLGCSDRKPASTGSRDRSSTAAETAATPTGESRRSAANVRPTEATELPSTMHWLVRPLGEALLALTARAEVLVELDDVPVVTLADAEIQLRSNPLGGTRHLESAEGRERFARQAVRFHLLAEEARARQLDETPDADFESVIALASAYRQSLLDEARTAEIDDAQVAAYYAEHKDRYERPARLAGHVLVVATEAEARAARTRILDEATTATPLRQRIFQQVARDVSTHRTGKIGGRLAPVAEPGAPLESAEDTALETEIRSALWAIDGPYRLGEPFPFGDGWGLALRGTQTAGVDVSLEAASPAIRRVLANAVGPEAVERRIAELERTIEVERNPGALAHLVVTRGTGISSDDVRPADDRADTVVVKAGETTLTLAMAAAALNRWPLAHQRAVYDADAGPAYVDSLARLVRLAEAGRRAGHGKTPYYALAIERYLVAAIGRTVRAEVTPELTDARAREYFETHPEEFVRAERRRPLQAVFDTEAGARDFLVRLAATRAGPGAAPRLRDDFQRLSAELSSDEAVRSRSGALPYITADDRDRMEVSQTLRDRVFALDEEGLSEPFLDGDHWRVLMVDAIREGIEVPFEDARVDIRRKLVVDPAEAAWDAFVESVVSRPGITVHPEVLTLLDLSDRVMPHGGGDHADHDHGSPAPTPPEETVAAPDETDQADEAATPGETDETSP